MSLKHVKISIFIISLLANISIGQSKKVFSLNFNYIISAFVYPNVISNDKGIRELSTEINDWFGISGEFRYEFKDGYFVGLSIEVVDKKIDDYLSRRISNQIIKIPVEDRFRIYIAELSLFFVAPFSSQKWNIYIGGGAGAYTGKFTKSIANVNSEIQKAPINIGIQVMSGVVYNFSDKLGARIELKFRDPIIETESKFKNNQINYNGYIIQIDPSPFRQRVNFDTMTFMLGVTYSF